MHGGEIASHREQTSCRYQGHHRQIGGEHQKSGSLFCPLHSLIIRCIVIILQGNSGALFMDLVVQIQENIAEIAKLHIL